MKTEPLTSAELTDLINGLNRLARNLWWTWNQEAQEIFQKLSPRAWQNLYHNAVAVLHEVSDYELRTRLQEPAFAKEVRNVLKQFDTYLEEPNTWAAQNAQKLTGKPVAYFSAEFGLSETLPIAAGGLGILAGDHAKSASDLGLPFVGISLFYRQGYFMQTVNEENWQTEYYSRLNPRNLPMEAVLDAKGEQLTCTVQIATSQVKFKIWKVNVGRIPIYLMDTDVPENEEHYRDLTLRVYGGDSTTRIMQEMLLGVGGVRLMRALDIQPSVFHMNEGHAAFLTLELMREKMATGKSLEEATNSTTKECIFTTHTPVEAGHDRFTSDLVQYAAHEFEKNLKISHQAFMDMGRVRKGDESEPFCMTVLALKHSRTANGVSELHGEISRHMWKDLYEDKKAEEVPIGHITNGIHVAGWMKGPLRRFFRRRLGDNWDADLNTHAFWNRMEDPEFVSDEEIWALRSLLRRELIEFSRRRLLLQSQSLKRENFITYDNLLNPDVLTIGFARRFATYKRAPLVFQQFEQIVKLVKDKQQAIQFIFAGKAHPRDDEGKKFIQHIIHLSKHTELHGHLVFIENYDIHVARQMVSGCDIWLNNPRRPLEASGTSGQKTSAHGCLNMSIMDGWWREAFDGTNGFAIGPDSQPDSIEEQDRVDSENLYNVLTKEVIPSFYNRDSAGVPRQWIQKIRRSMSTITPEYNTWRMVQDYANKYYLTGE
ncbi:MAG: alpha-glucan family phosphorylase [Verrucomicrobia bacterium]|jgi:glycogen phosphorylase|nr:alpha-glucan family phosphorylase [Verrucomicrobiota bacterium]